MCVASARLGRATKWNLRVKFRDRFPRRGWPVEGPIKDDGAPEDIPFGKSESENCGGGVVRDEGACSATSKKAWARAGKEHGPSWRWCPLRAMLESTRDCTSDGMPGIGRVRDASGEALRRAYRGKGESHAPSYRGRVALTHALSRCHVRHARWTLAVRVHTWGSADWILIVDYAGFLGSYASDPESDCQLAQCLPNLKHSAQGVKRHLTTRGFLPLLKSYERDKIGHLFPAS